MNAECAPSVFIATFLPIRSRAPRIGLSARTKKPFQLFSSTPLDAITWRSGAPATIIVITEPSAALPKSTSRVLTAWIASGPPSTPPRYSSLSGAR